VILEQLLVCFVQVGVLALVLPRKAAFFPNVGAALSALCLIRAGFKGEKLSGGVGFGRCGVADQGAEVIEMRLGRGAFFQVNVFPFGDELLGSPGCLCMG
jgi:hypothetical protein